MKDYYLILGVNRNASVRDISIAFRKLAKQFHPDVNRSSDAEERFIEIYEAYEILSNVEKRQRYDFLYGKIRDNQESNNSLDVIKKEEKYETDVNYAKNKGKEFAKKPLSELLEILGIYILTASLMVVSGIIYLLIDTLCLLLALTIMMIVFWVPFFILFMILPNINLMPVRIIIMLIIFPAYCVLMYRLIRKTLKESVPYYNSIGFMNSLKYYIGAKVFNVKLS